MRTSENRPRYNRDKLRYPRDLTDDEWSRIEFREIRGEASAA